LLSVSNLLLEPITVVLVRVLQQWWEDRIYKGSNWFVEGGEWRDVPVEKEE
jgi:hypothetical protein